MTIATVTIAFASSCVGLLAGALCCAAGRAEDAARVQRAAEALRTVRAVAEARMSTQTIIERIDAALREMGQ